MNHENAVRRRGAREDAHLVEDFEPQSGTFLIGVKALNMHSVLAAHGQPQRVLTMAARHLTREIRAELGGAIEPRMSCSKFAGQPIIVPAEVLKAAGEQVKELA